MTDEVQLEFDFGDEHKEDSPAYFNGFHALTSIVGSILFVLLVAMVICNG
jgi:hypothetical protein